jgi:hypothetical protein
MFNRIGRKEPYLTSDIVVAVVVCESTSSICCWLKLNNSIRSLSIISKQGSGFPAGANDPLRQNAPQSLRSSKQSFINNHQVKLSQFHPKSHHRCRDVFFVIPPDFHRAFILLHLQKWDCRKIQPPRFYGKANQIAEYSSRLLSLRSHPGQQRKLPLYHDLRSGDSEPFAVEVRGARPKIDAGAYKISWRQTQGKMDKLQVLD